MAVRRESVQLILDDQFSTKMARAAAATALFKRELDGLDGTQVTRDMDDTSKGLDKVGESSRRAAPEIDKLSGRLRLFTDLAVTLGPAAIRLGAGAIPALTGSIAGLGAAAGGLGVTIAALSGFGDALDAVSAYDLEPTAENLQKLRIEQEKLGPSGAAFLDYLTSLGPVLKDLQFTTRDGIFPGMQDGIEDLLTRLPEVTKIVNRLSQTIGDLSADAGASLAGEDFDAFFKYLKTDAAPTLEGFSKSLGNVVLGVANLLVAFAPASRDFTAGLEDMTKRFAEWTAQLGEDQSFQEFLSYVRDAGPDAVQFIGAIARAMAGLLEAGAPLGSVLLPALTSLLDVFASIAGSDAGPALYAAAAGLVAFNRAASITGKVGPRLTATFEGMSRARLAAGAVGGLGLLAASLTDVDDKAGVANTTMGAFAGLLVGGPWGAAAGAAIGQYQDLSDATEEWTANIEKADAALRSGSVAQQTSELENLRKKYQDLQDDVPDDPLDFLGTLLNPSKLQGNNEAMKAYAARISELETSLSQGGDVADLFGESVGRTGAQLRIAAGDATAFSGALAELNGWLDKGDAIANYRSGLKDLSESLKDGFNPDVAQAIRDQGRDILQVADKMKDPGTRADFLAGARKSLEGLAEEVGPKAERALDRLIAKFDDEGLTHPPAAEFTVDDSRAQTTLKKNKGDLAIMGRSVAEPKIAANDSPFRQTYGTVKGAMREANNLRANPKIDADVSKALFNIQLVRSAMAQIVSKSVTVSVNKVLGSLTDGESADGGTVRGRRYPYADKMLYAVAPGEEIVSNRHGQADRNRALLKAINAGRYGADGRTVGGLVRNTYVNRTAADPDEPKASDSDDEKDKKAREKMRHGTLFLTAEFEHLSVTSKNLDKVLDRMTSAAEKNVEKVTKAYDKQKSAMDEQAGALDRAKDTLNSLASSIASKFDLDLGADLSSGTNVWAAGGGRRSLGGLVAETTAKAEEYPAIVAALQAAGVNGRALEEILEEMDLNQLRELVANPGQAAELAAGLTGLYGAAASAGAAVGQAVYGDEVRAQTVQLQLVTRAAEAQLAELKEAKQAVKDLEKTIKAEAAQGRGNADQNAADNASLVAAGVNGGATKGRRNRTYAR